MTRTILITALLLVLAPAIASADELAGLQLDIGANVDALVRQDVTKAVDDALGSAKLKWLGVDASRAKVNPVARDCFTADCLAKVRTATGAEAGVRIQFSGESQIYDWRVDMYDLRDGKLLVTERGACELCGRAEVLEQFSTTLTKVASTNVPTSSATTATTEPKPTTAPPPRQVEETTPPPLTVPDAQPTDDPTAGLVMIEISVEPSDAEISLGGEVLGTGNAAVSLERGTYVFQFRREGYQGLDETFVVGPQTSQRALMRVHLSKTDPDAVYVGGSEGPVDRLGAQRKTYGIIGLAAGGSLLVLGAWFNYLDGRPACADASVTDCPEVYATGGLAFASTLAGAALITGGAVFLAWEVLAGDSEEESARLLPFLGSDGAGVGVFGRF